MMYNDWEMCWEKKSTKNPQKNFSTAVMPDLVFFIIIIHYLACLFTRVKLKKNNKNKWKKGATERFTAVQQQVTRAN